MKKICYVILFLILSVTMLMNPMTGFAMNDEKSDQEAIYKLIDNLEHYYERRRSTKFIDLFSQRKFTNYIPFKQAVENDFDLYDDIKLKRFNERLYLSDKKAIYQATWEKQYRPTLRSPFQRQRGLVRILLEKYGGEWKIIDLQGYPIFGSSEVLYPDLTVTNVWIMGGGRRIVGVVKNIGGKEAKSFYVGFYAGSTFLGKAYVSKLDKNESKSISWVWTPAPDRRLSDVRVVADVSGQVRESREDNNVGKIPIRPGDTSYCVDLALSGRDLYVPSTVQPGSVVLVGSISTKAPKGDVKTVKVGDKLRICVTFHNIGGLNAATVPVKVYYVTERPDKTVTIFQRVYPQIPSKGKIRFCFFWRVPDLERKPSEKTRRYIRAVLDPDNSLPECSEANNVVEQEIFIVSGMQGHDGTLTADSDIILPPEICPLHGATIDPVVEVRDQDLVGDRKVQVTMTVDSGDRETFYLSSVSPGVFRRNLFPACRLPLATPPPPVPGNGRLELTGNGGVITVKYVDQLDSNGKTVVRTRLIHYTP